MYSRLSPIRPVLLDPTGLSFADPWGWTDKLASGTGPLSVAIEFNWDNSESSNKYFAVKLTASTAYTIYGVDTYSRAKVDIYNSSGTRVGGNTGGWAWIGPEEWDEGWVMPDAAFTPGTTGTYVVMISNGGEMPEGGATYATYISPRPSTLSVGGYTPYHTSRGFDDEGYIVRRSSAMEVGLVFPSLSAPNDLTALDSNPEWLVDASAAYAAGEAAWKAFNGSTGLTTNRWMTGGDTAGWIRWKSLTNKRLIRHYKVYATNESGWEHRSPKTWTLEGSDDGTNWTVIHTVEDGFGSSPSGFQEASFTVPAGNSTYFYHRMNITATYSSGYLSVGQIKATS